MQWETRQSRSGKDDGCFVVNTGSPWEMASYLKNGDHVGKPKTSKAIKSASDNAWHFAMYALVT
jgi:hypothetical protein